MKVIKLVHGPGNGVDTACVLSAASILIGKPEELDGCYCVCPVIGSFVARTNDSMPLCLLREVYGDLPWEIIGTSTKDERIMSQRALHFFDVVVRQVLPWTVYIEDHNWLMELPKIDTIEAAKAAVRLEISAQSNV